MKLITIILIFLSCKNEYSREGYTIPVVDSIPVIDTIKTYFVTYDIYVPNNLEISHINVEILNDLQPVFYAFETIAKVDSFETYRYKETFDVGWLMETMPIGQPAYFRYAIVYPGPRFEYSNITDIIIK